MTKRASEMTIERIEDVLRQMNWTEIHKARVFSDYGDSVVLYTDGTFSVQDSSTHYRDPDAAGVIGYLRCWGQGNIDRTVYYEGWAEPVEDGYLVSGAGYEDDEIYGTVISEDRMIEIAIEDGQWQDDYDEAVEAILESVREERRYRAEVYGA
jgi:hypothetical protein